MSGHQRPVRGESDSWLTPPEIIKALGPFSLDPCASVDQPWPTAEVQYTVVDNGLLQTWNGFVFLNPPFGPEAEHWFAKLAKHPGGGIGLCPARTETRWFVREVWAKANAILFLHGRPYFHKPDGTRGSANSGAPICLVGYGPKAVDRLATCGLSGSLVREWG
jgi:hypothetical protein